MALKSTPTIAGAKSQTQTIAFSSAENKKKPQPKWWLFRTPPHFCRMRLELVIIYVAIIIFGSEATPSLLQEISWRASPRYYFPPTLSIAAFNVKALGQTKSDDEKILIILADIICRYDLIAILEIRDAEQQVIPKLLDVVYKRCSGQNYGYRPSIRQGSKNFKEQIAFLYRRSSILARNTTILQSDRFERPPFMGHFVARNAPWFEFIAIAAHLKPAKAVDELKAISIQYEKTIRNFERKASSIFIIGDLNADGSYVPNAEKPEIKLFNDPSYSWLIPTGTATMVTENNKTYDRIVMKQHYCEFVIPGSAGVFRYDKVINLRGKKPSEISDHWPIHMKLIARRLSHDGISSGYDDSYQQMRKSKGNSRLSSQQDNSFSSIPVSRKKDSNPGRKLMFPKMGVRKRKIKKTRLRPIRAEILDDNYSEDEWPSDAYSD